MTHDSSSVYVHLVTNDKWDEELPPNWLRIFVPWIFAVETCGNLVNPRPYATVGRQCQAKTSFATTKGLESVCSIGISRQR
jgi:hypothetical protein